MIIKEIGKFVFPVDVFISVPCDLCLQRVTIPSRELDVNVSDLSLVIPHARSPPSVFALVFPPLFLLKLMTWLLISAVWGPSTPLNGLIQALFIPIFNYI